MEQELKTTGLKKINWTELYKNVSRGGKHTYPTVHCMCYGAKDINNIVELAQENPGCDFVLDIRDGVCKIEASTISNVTYFVKERLSEKEQIEWWGRVDFVYCKEGDIENLLPAMLSGVEPIFNKKDIKVSVENFPLRVQNIERINWFEKGKNLFDTLF